MDTAQSASFSMIPPVILLIRLLKLPTTPENALTAEFKAPLKSPLKILAMAVTISTAPIARDFNNPNNAAMFSPQNLTAGANTLPNGAAATPIALNISATLAISARILPKALITPLMLAVILGSISAANFRTASPTGFSANCICAVAERHCSAADCGFLPNRSIDLPKSVNALSLKSTAKTASRPMSSN